MTTQTDQPKDTRPQGGCCGGQSKAKAQDTANAPREVAPPPPNGGCGCGGARNEAPSRGE